MSCTQGFSTQGLRIVCFYRVLHIKPIRTYGFYEYNTDILSTKDVMVTSVMHTVF